MPEQNQKTTDPKAAQADPKANPAQKKKAGPKIKPASHYKKLGLDPKVYGAK